MNSLQLACVLIPAFKPSESLLSVVSRLKLLGLQDIIIINDGSGEEFNFLFDQLQHMGVFIINHPVNLGKGAALKTGFIYFLSNFKNKIGVITADADGQHAPEDIVRLSDKFSRDPNALILGCRSFDEKIPFRSKVGNKLTLHLSNLLIGLKITDTQTGLRAIPMALLPDLLKIKSNGYEYEMDMLIRVHQKNTRIEEMTIKTIYEDGNVSSHFNPIIDSAKIYFVLFRFSLNSLASQLIDTLVFLVAMKFTNAIFLSTVISRCVAGFFNFKISKRYVFHSIDRAAPEVIKYVLSVVTLMLISYGFVTYLVVVLGFSLLPAKIISESLLFILSFSVQRIFVFVKQRSTNNE
jgi:glycosyltransferase involved in cell wall biosynthesis